MTFPATSHMQIRYTSTTYIIHVQEWNDWNAQLVFEKPGKGTNYKLERAIKKKNLQIKGGIEHSLSFSLVAVSSQSSDSILVFNIVYVYPCIQWRLVVMRAILFVSRDKKERGLLSVVGGAWTRALRLTSPRNVRTIRVLTISKPLLYTCNTLRVLTCTRGYMVIGQTHVYRVQVQRMIACYLLTSGCRIEISQIVTIQSVNARNQVNYAPLGWMDYI